MSSARMLELVNCLHHELSDSSNVFPFACKQPILVGEFHQLRPVPSKFDDGRFMFKSYVFNFAISHRFELTEIMRQLSGEWMFIDALKELRLGLCSPECCSFSSAHSRDLFEQACDVIHIFLKTVPAILFNRCEVAKLPGDATHFQASHECDTQNMNMAWRGHFDAQKRCAMWSTA